MTTLVALLNWQVPASTGQLPGSGAPRLSDPGGGQTAQTAKDVRRSRLGNPGGPGRAIAVGLRPGHSVPVGQRYYK